MDDPVTRAKKSDAARASWAATTDRTARTAPARQAIADRFLRDVDPDGVLPIVERARRAAQARRAHMLRLAARSAEVRRARRAGGEA